MRGLPTWYILVATILSYLILPAFAIPDPRLKQATRAEVVSRVRRGPIAPRVSSCTSPSGAAPATVTAGYTYNRVYSGSGYTENPNNPGTVDDTNYPPKTSTFANTNVATAIQQCAHTADNTPSEPGLDYWSFDLYFYTSTCSWSCTIYFNTNIYSSYFNVANTDVALGYGYSVYV